MYPPPPEVVQTENKIVQTITTLGKKQVITSPRSPEKEVNFSNVLATVAQRHPPGNTQSKPSTFPKPIIKKGIITSPTPKGVIGTIGLIGLESDQESETDAYQKIKKEAVHESDCADDSILSPDEEDDDFKVHFVHHGKKGKKMEQAQNAELTFQINELQEAVVSMKSSLKEAMSNLSLMDNGPSQSDFEEMKRKCDGNASEILKMVLSLKTDFSSLRNDVVSISKRQEILQSSLRLLLADRRALTSDQAGLSSKDQRTRLDSSNSMIGGGETGGHSESGSHSNDSGVALPVDKISNSAYNDASGTLRFSGQRTSDQDSLPDQPSLLVPPSVYDYVAGLSDAGTVYSPGNYTSQYFDQDNSLISNRDQRIYSSKKTERVYGQKDDAGLTYDSDSSLLVASPRVYGMTASRSQDLLKTDIYSSHSTATPYSTLAFNSSMDSGPKNQRHLESNPKMNENISKPYRESRSRSVSKDRTTASQARRKKMSGNSSNKSYHSTSHSHPAPGDRDSRESRSGHRTGGSRSDNRESQRYKIAKELLDTEKQYCRTLWTIQDTFADPLKKEAMLSNRDLTTLFPEEINQLYEKHCLLQHQLKERLASWKWQPVIGDILSRFTDPHQCEALRLYAKYVNDFPEVLKTFHRLNSSSQPFTNFINKCLDQPNCRGMDLGSLLLSPVQRVPKYILILKYLLKYTESSHPDYHSIYTVLERLRDFLARLNDAMENSFRLVNSSSSSSTKTYAGLTVITPGDKYGTINRDNRQTIYEPSSNDTYRVPRRSTSNAGGGNSIQGRPTLSVAPGRSASLPRGFTSASSESPDSSEGHETPPEPRAPSRCGPPKGSPLPDTATYQSRIPRRKYHTLTPARSVTNVASGDLSLKRWDDLAASEPSLIDPKQPLQSRPTPQKTPSPTIQPPVTISTASTHKLVTWTDSVEATEEAKAKKKPTIKSSLKNMFSFKKRSSDEPHKSGEEPIYWPSSLDPQNDPQNRVGIYGTSQLTQSQPTPHNHQTPPKPSHNPTHSSQINLHQTSQPQPNGTHHGQPSTKGQNGSSPPQVGDFLDEDGNPCSNV